MGWIAEARAIKQQKYGVYCVLCSQKGIGPVPYHSFTLEHLTNIKSYENNKSK